MERIGARYKHCTLDSFDAADNPLALEAARALADGSLEMLLLFGGAGRGKTHLLIAAGRDYERPAVAGHASEPDERGHRYWIDGIPARTSAFWPVLELVGALRGCAGGRCDDPEPSCRRAGLLLLDDYGAETCTDYAWEGLQRILDYRYREKRGVGISTNLTPEEWTQRYGDQMLSRLSEGGRIVRMTGRDRRPERGRS
ncbi:MAG TPA: hypothetical protein PLX54_10570 [Candidatus Fermentibacter daniensis]|jgi:DNA replication protein DnaC|nr:hypothetical protein [Candidatus Fermentibacter daniensis]HOZ18743.1 hypothetical protein [Candidatus Fermentibacter daniensis]HPK52788.1 hypothetical protein [Candidatus Fermentibacter daniensis]